MRCQAAQGKSGKLRFSEGWEQYKSANITETITVCTKITIVLILLQVLLLYIRLISGNQEKWQQPPTHPRSALTQCRQKGGSSCGRTENIPWEETSSKAQCYVLSPSLSPRGLSPIELEWQHWLQWQQEATRDGSASARINYLFSQDFEAFRSQHRPDKMLHKKSSTCSKGSWRTLS